MNNIVNKFRSLVVHKRSSKNTSMNNNTKSKDETGLSKSTESRPNSSEQSLDEVIVNFEASVEFGVTEGSQAEVGKAGKVGVHEDEVPETVRAKQRDDFDDKENRPPLHNPPIGPGEGSGEWEKGSSCDDGSDSCGLKSGETEPLTWHDDPPMFRVSEIRRLYNSDRVAPLLTFAAVGVRRMSLAEPVDYLVGWASPTTVVAAVLDERRAREPRVPLLVRLGGLWAPAAPAHLYVGCVVRVEQLVRTMDRDGLPTKWVSGATHNPLHDLFYAGVPKPCAFATRWTTVHRPAVSQTLGTVLKATAATNLLPRLAIEAQVLDVEYHEPIVTLNDHWPLDLEQLPEVATPVILNWVHLRGVDHVLCPRRLGAGNTHCVLPAHLNYVDHASEILQDSFVFAWIDTSFERMRPLQL